jgi:hypothetical protein
MGLVDVGTLKGRVFTTEEFRLVEEVVETFPGLSRSELALTVCELLEWRRPNGNLKARECREVLEDLERRGDLKLPEKRRGRRRGQATKTLLTEAGEAGEPLVGSVHDVGPVQVKLVEEQREKHLFRELLGRYHYLGYRMPFGARLQYLVQVLNPEVETVGVVQFSSPAWRLSARDQWIGWSDEQRGKNLQRVVSNSRFMLVPWCQVRNLASKVLSLVVKRLAQDWAKQYGLLPLLAETMVDHSRFSGTSYKAANWIEVGTTTGRGRMDKGHERHGMSPKTVFVYPMARDAARRLCED